MIQYNTVEEALEELRKGHVILVTDDADRVICSRWWQRKTECWSEMDIQKQPLICVAWPV